MLETRLEVHCRCWRYGRWFGGGAGDPVGGTLEVLETLAMEMVVESDELGKSLAS